MGICWFLYNPLSYNILNIIFGILLIIGILLFIMNLVKLATTQHYTSPIIGIIVSLLVIGISIKWETILPLITEIMSGITHYLIIYIYLLIQQWLIQTPLLPTTIILT
ncbi:MAG: hypothetical protein QXV37_01060 [Candidatus Jordarchaeaceae archaeon]